jgi:hypothetical protein
MTSLHPIVNLLNITAAGGTSKMVAPHTKPDHFSLSHAVSSPTQSSSRSTLSLGSLSCLGFRRQEAAHDGGGIPRRQLPPSRRGIPQLPLQPLRLGFHPREAVRAAAHGATAASLGGSSLPARKAAAPPEPLHRQGVASSDPPPPPLPSPLPPPTLLPP